MILASQKEKSYGQKTAPKLLTKLKSKAAVFKKGQPL
jgi:hypothetical protein